MFDISLTVGLPQPAKAQPLRVPLMEVVPKAQRASIEHAMPRLKVVVFSSLLDVATRRPPDVVPNCFGWVIHRIRTVKALLPALDEFCNWSEKFPMSRSSVGPTSKISRLLGFQNPYSSKTGNAIDDWLDRFWIGKHATRTAGTSPSTVAPLLSEQSSRFAHILV